MLFASIELLYHLRRRFGGLRYFVKEDEVLMTGKLERLPITRVGAHQLDVRNRVQGWVLWARNHVDDLDISGDTSEETIIPLG